MTTATWRPAWYCPHAVHTLCWDETRLAWSLAHSGQMVGTLPGFPVGQPQVDGRAAVAWADTIVGPQQWIQHPARSAAWHTHEAAS